MPLSRLLTVIATVITLSGLAVIEAKADQTDTRQKRQRKRIQQGVKEGEISKDEAKKLRKGNRRVKRMEKKAKKDGTVTKKEKRKLNKAQNKQSKRIHKAKNNEEKKEEN